MMRDRNNTSAARREACLRPYWRALGCTSLVWVVVLVAVLGRHLVASQWLGESAIVDESIIAIASLLIAYASMVPNLVAQRALCVETDLQRSEIEGVPNTTESSQAAPLVAGVVIRLIGTVALFLTCRYQMATPVEVVAAMTIGWYVLLTFVDVLVLARELPKPNASAERTATRIRTTN